MDTPLPHKLKQFAQRCCTEMASEFPAISKIWPLIEKCDFFILNQLLSQIMKKISDKNFIVKLGRQPENFSEHLEALADWLPTLVVELIVTPPESHSADSEYSYLLKEALGNLFMGVAGAKTRQILIRTTIFGCLHIVVNWSAIRDTLDLTVTSLSVQHVELPRNAIDACNHQVDKAKVKLDKLHDVVKTLLADQPLEALFSGIHPVAWHATLMSDYGAVELNRDPLTVFFGSRRFFLFHHYRDVQWTLFSLDALGQTEYIEITRCRGISTTPSWGIRTLSQEMDPGTFSNLKVLSACDHDGNICPISTI